MLNISKPLSASQAQTYHAKEFTAGEQNYWKQGDTIQGEWHGKLAAEFGLSGAVGAEEFARLSEGQHPQTGKQLVSHRVVHEYRNAEGSMVSPVEHRAGWHARFSAPKYISLTALVGDDDRVREAHREAVNVALNELEGYTQASIGGNNPAETTGEFAAAKFEHGAARPVDGYAAPQLHTHVVVFNMTESENGKVQALQPHSLFESQQFATAVYQAHLTHKLRSLGCEIEPGKSGAPDIEGYTQAVLLGRRPRRLSRITPAIRKSSCLPIKSWPRINRLPMSSAIRLTVWWPRRGSAGKNRHRSDRNRSAVNRHGRPLLLPAIKVSSMRPTWTNGRFMSMRCAGAWAR